MKKLKTQLVKKHKKFTNIRFSSLFPFIHYVSNFFSNRYFILYLSIIDLVIYSIIMLVPFLPILVTKVIILESSIIYVFRFFKLKLTILPFLYLLLCFVSLVSHYIPVEPSTTLHLKKRIC